MIAICHKCGTPKAAPNQRCGSCGGVPVNDEELALAFMLTDQFLPKEKLAEASRLIKSGQRIELPPHFRTAVLAATQSARIQQARAEKEQGLSLRGGGILAGIAAILFLIFHPWPHYQWSTFQDSVQSYEGFANRFPSSGYLADSAKERTRVLREPDAWSHAKETDQIEALRGYVRMYPEGKHLDDAQKRIAELADARWKVISDTDSKSTLLKFLKYHPETTKRPEVEARIVTIADGEWRKIAAGRSVVAIEKFLEDYHETSMRAEAEQRIQELHNDLEWVREQDSLDHYQRFATRYPDHSERSWIEKRIIDLEVKQIAAGEYGELPRAKPLSYGGSTVEVEVENQTVYELTARYSGPESKKLVITRGATQKVSLPPGDYKVAASVTAANVRNYYGTDVMRGGQYSSIFYIQSEYGGFPIPSHRPSRR